MNHLIRITAVMVKEFCEILCYIEPDCVSINIDKERMDMKCTNVN